jgi:hypothetical protein
MKCILNIEDYVLPEYGYGLGCGDGDGNGEGDGFMYAGGSAAYETGVETGYKTHIENTNGVECGSGTGDGEGNGYGFGY